MKNQDYTSHRTLHTSQKGITLIALIITIIVMLILVGVTINVALNGGLFTKGEQAKTETQLAADREELQMAVIAALNNNREIPNVAAMKNNLQGEWIVTGNAGGPYTCISPNGNKFVVDNKGNIEPGENGGGGQNPGDDVSDINEEDKIYNVVYSYQGDEAKIILYKSGIFTMQSPSLSSGMGTGIYQKNENELTLYRLFTDGAGIIFTISEGGNTITSEAGEEFIRHASRIDNYNPEFTDATKGIYKNSLYMNVNKTKAISVSEETIYLRQDYIFSTRYSIELSSFVKENNDQISVNGDGTVITYDGEEYTLITKEQMNSAT